ncbi:isocitrate lyase/PEP mutase family protein [Actinopolymorpha pittospori]|uniref:2-methylisocitrate lyase-like PEP mutase family enzyme n=1 Tax=Actinopolymorpha pittospori TaxID=648752 RepID=A0A927N6T5_9ACTN|nr:oxaloacetate decarboxylase [Actinopolymorpha pittospori]MBE1613134.1 2-methylisocitrate lyase-like PEP mutase family enzyme [Actinopolymorpha pittospori]
MSPASPPSRAPTTRLRRRLATGSPPLLLPGAPNALTARVIEESGFEAVYVSGAGVTNTFLGSPDLGLLTLDELVAHAAAMRDAVELPLVVDADTGFGNAINVRRTVRRLERAGAAAIQIEDQVNPKKCGHFAGKEVIAAAEMVGKVAAAVDARTDDDLLIIARTDARATDGLDEACERANAYLAAGADIAFVEAPRSIEEMRQVTARVPGLHVANMVEGGLTPLQPLGTLRDLGFAIALYANTAMRGAILGMRDVLLHLGEHGDTLAAGELMVTWEERQALVRKPYFDELDQRYAGDTQGPTPPMRSTE